MCLCCDPQRLIQESRKAENEQLKAQVLALNGELLQVRMQLSGSLPAAAPQHLKASIRTTSGANVELFGSAVDASVSESARLEALARAADLKALQLCAEQLKGAVQRLSEKEQVGQGLWFGLGFVGEVKVWPKRAAAVCRTECARNEAVGSGFLAVG